MKNFKLPLFLFLISFFCFLPSISRADITTGLVGYWPFDENIGTVANDFSGNSNNGTISGGTTWTNGKMLGALNFDGVDDRVNLPNSLTGFNFGSNSFTVGMWINPSSFSNQSSYIRPFEIAYCGASPAYIFGQFSTTTNSQNSFQLGGYDSNGTYFGAISAPNSVSLNQWQHIVAVADRTNNKIQIYLNGSLSGQSNINITGTINCSNATIAATIGSWSTGAYFQGSMDDVRFYNRALLAQEVQDLFNLASSTVSSDITPPYGFLNINNGALYANSASVTLNIIATDNVGVSGYYISENNTTPQADNPNWISVTSVPNYSSNVLYTPSGSDGAKTVYIWYKDEAGNVSNMASDTIILNSNGNYYVDSVSGNDSNDGITANSPWKTISKINNSTFFPGSNILFKRGGVWREQLVVPSSGTLGQPITFGAYSDGEKPVINASRIVNNWSVYNGNIYTADIDLDIKQVFVDGKYYDVAHYPNGGSYLIIDQNSTDKTYLIDNDLNLSNEQISGAEVYMKLVPWHIENKTASSYDQTNHKIQLNGSAYHDIRKDYGYYLTNKLWMLDEPMEWFYDNSAKKLYIWLENNENPNSHNIEVSENDSGVKITNKSYVTLKDIMTDKAKLNGINISGSNNITLQNLNISNSGQHGIGLSNTSVSILKNNSVNSSVVDGVHITGGTGIDVLDNTVQNSGNIGVQPKKGYAGIFLADFNNLNINVKNNTIINNGYIGVFFNGRNINIENNFISNSCFILDDCGGIHTSDDSSLSHGNNKIIGNIVKDSVGNYFGTSYSASKLSQAEGIYLDDRAGNVTVSDNTIINTNRGIFLHNAFKNIVTNNNIFKARKNGLIFVEGDDFNGIIKDNVITSNIFFGTSTNDALIQHNAWGTNTNFGVYNSNWYGHFYYDYLIARSGAGSGVFSLSSWQSNTGQDSSSKNIGDFYEVQPYKAAPLGNNLVLNEKFDQNINSWTKWSADNTASTSWISSCGLDGGCLKAKMSAVSSLLISNNFPIYSGKTYQVNLSVIASQADNNFKVIVRKGSPNYDTYGSKYYAINNTRKEISFTFTNSADVPNARIDIENSVANAEYYIDNISIKEASVFYDDSSDDSVIYYNETKTAKTVDLGGVKYCDVDNNTVEGVITLNPYSSKILLSCFNNNDFVCNNKESNDTASNDCAVGEYGLYAPKDSSTGSSLSSATGNSGGGPIPDTINPGVSVPNSGVATTTATTTPNQSALADATGQASSKFGVDDNIQQLFIKPIKLKSEGEEVKQLQKFLSQDKEIYPEGLITGYYGNLTVKAVQRFQKKHGIVSTGSPETTGYGLAGPKTIIKLNELARFENPEPTTVVGSAGGNKELTIIQLKQQIIELMIKVIEMLKKRQ